MLFKPSLLSMFQQIYIHVCIERGAWKLTPNTNHEPVGFKRMPVGSKINHELHLPKQRRALVTRAQLIQSARTIFARDGFEQARIEDIAALAGKTRGAFYANFKDKEDVFFAIFEENIAQDLEGLPALLTDLHTAHERLDALAAYILELAKDPQRTLLHLEFKVYAIRHPRRRKRLADLHAAMRERCSYPEFDAFFPEFQQQTKQERRKGSLAIGAIVDGLALNRLFDPDAIADAQLMLHLRLVIRQAMQLGFVEVGTMAAQKTKRTRR